jgi:DNA-binding response OmpR family regulator
MNIEETIHSAHLLIADDEDNTRDALIRGLQLMGYTTEGAADGRQVLNRLACGGIDLVLLDLRMPEVDGTVVMETICRDYPDLAVVVLTAYASLDSALTAIRTGVTDYLLKPQRIVDIEEAIRKALKQKLADQQRKRMIDVLDSTLQLLRTDSPTSEPEVNAAPSGASPYSIHTNVVFDPEQHCLIVKDEGEHDQIIKLTADQSAILQFMVRNPHRMLSNREIAHTALGYDHLDEIQSRSIVRPHILRLRRKIEGDTHQPAIIRTIRGSGYLFFPE